MTIDTMPLDQNQSSFDLLFSWTDKNQQAIAERYAAQFNGNTQPEASVKTNYRIHCHNDKVQLICPNQAVLVIDFTAGKNAHRKHFGGGHGQELARAVGSKPNTTLNIVDATAGFARDAFVLASLGHEVTLIERCVWLIPLIEQALEVAKNDPNTTKIASRMHLIHGQAYDVIGSHSAIDSITQSNQKIDAIYLDPMYPQRDQRATPKKDMQALHDLAGENSDDAAILAVAQKKCHGRVIVKRPLKAPLLSKTQPSGAIKSKNTRYDIYPGLGQ